MNYTEYKGFKKPESTDLFNIGDFNDNWDIADSSLKELDKLGAGVYFCTGTDDIDLPAFMDNADTDYIRIIGEFGLSDEGSAVSIAPEKHLTLDFTQCKTQLLTSRNLSFTGCRIIGLDLEFDYTKTGRPGNAVTFTDCEAVSCDLNVEMHYSHTAVKAANSRLMDCNISAHSETTVTAALNINNSFVDNSTVISYSDTNGDTAGVICGGNTTMSQSTIRAYTLGETGDTGGQTAIKDSTDGNAAIFLSGVICDEYPVEGYFQDKSMEITNGAKGCYNGYFFIAPIAGDMVDNGAVYPTQWSDELVSLVPTMTGYTTPSGEVVYSANYGDSRYAWYAFDGTDSQTFSSSAWSDSSNVIDGDPDTIYCGYVFPEGTEVKVHEVEVASFSDRSYTAVIQTYDGENWTTAVENVTLPNTYYNKQTVTLEEDIVCKGIRLCIVSGAEQYMAATRYGCAICEITVNGYNKL